MAETLFLWLLLVVPIAAQVPLLLYMMRHIQIEEEPTHRSQEVWGYDDPNHGSESEPARTTTVAATRPTRTAADGNSVCPRCAAVNDPGYRFCHNCVGAL